MSSEPNLSSRSPKSAAGPELTHAAVNPSRVRVRLSEGLGLEIDWADGHQSAWSFVWLRNACPCSSCTAEREKQGRRPGEPAAPTADLLKMYAPPPKPRSAHPVGRYAIQFEWLDGHSGGIYSWEYLRRLCGCEPCRAGRAGQS